MKRAFTLLELLIVIGIMGLMGTLALGGYRAMERGMAERGVMESVNSFIRAAYQRAQIDGQPTAIYFWNETKRSATDHHSLIVVGRAVAVRRSGRLTRVEIDYLYDEFADLDLTYDTSASETPGATSEAATMFLYPMDTLSRITSSGNLLRSEIESQVYPKSVPVFLPSSSETAAQGNSVTTDTSGIPELKTHAFKLVNQNGVTWKPGMAYGFEFATLELPRNYLFGSAYSDNANRPVEEAGTLVFDVGGVAGRSTIQVSSLRPNDRGILAAEKVDMSVNPTQEMQ